MSDPRPTLAERLAAEVRCGGRAQVLLARDSGLTEKHISQMLNHGIGSVAAWDRLLRVAHSAAAPAEDAAEPAPVADDEREEWTGESYYVAHGWSGCEGSSWWNLTPATRDGWEAAAREARRAPVADDEREALASCLLRTRYGYNDDQIAEMRTWENWVGRSLWDQAMDEADSVLAAGFRRAPVAEGRSDGDALAAVRALREAASFITTHGTYHEAVTRERRGWNQACAANADYLEARADDLAALAATDGGTSESSASTDL